MPEVLDALEAVVAGLNDPQRAAVLHDAGPLLVIAGAGTGKTRTLVHRAAAHIARGVDPRRILLLTFTRRSAAEMVRRVEGLLQALGGTSQTAQPRFAAGRVWGGTFHSVATRLLRAHGELIGLPVDFTIHDRSDSEDLVHVVRTELGLASTKKRFPAKGACMAIYSHCINSQQPIEQVLADGWPWCRDYAEQLKELLRGYIDRKTAAAVLDYDDLLLYWRALLQDEQAGRRVRERFDCVLVDEYQDTNTLQSDMLRLLCPEGRGLTVVGDDAQSIYSFRAATVRNILDFPQQYPGATVVKLEQNYRSRQPVLQVSNLVIAEARERYEKQLWSARAGGEQPSLVLCDDEQQQADFVAEQVLAHREMNIALKQQAVLFRASHHSILLEAELTRRNVPFVKYGGLKFMEAGHVKDLLAFLRLAENPRDVVAGSRVLLLLAGIGPARARQLMAALLESRGDFAIWQQARVPAAAREAWPKFVALMQGLVKASNRDVGGQVGQVRQFYDPLLEERYEHAAARRRDLEQIELLASQYDSRQAMLAEIALDPPSSTEDFAGVPRLDEDYLVLSTIHSAKGLEWDAVYVIHAADGNIPSDMATGSVEQIEEERRLFYVALTRARDWLYICWPQRYYQSPRGDRHGYALLTRFVTDSMKPLLAARTARPAEAADENFQQRAAEKNRQVREQARAMFG